MKHSIDLVISPPAGVGAESLDGIAALRDAFSSGVIALDQVAPESWWFRRFGIDKQADWPAGPFRATGGGFRLCADPVHLAVSGDAVVLDAGVSLTPAEAESFIERLNAHFTVDGLRLSAASPDQWVLESDTDIDATTTPTARVHGRSIEFFLPRGAAARRLKRFGNEAQMLLHEVQLNLEREARGAAPVNGIWLWGGGRIGAARAVTGKLKVLSDALHVRGIAHAAQANAMPLPAGPVEIGMSEGDHIVDLATPYASPEGWAEWLARTWIEPLRHTGCKVRAHVLLPDCIASTNLFGSDLLRLFRRGGLSGRLARSASESKAS